MTTKTLILGGYGAVGREAAAALAGHSAVVVAGRNPSKAPAGVEALRLDLTEFDQVEAALDGVGAVLMCAEIGNARVARAALGRGIDYADVSATPSVLTAIGNLRTDQGGGPAGATAVLSVGIAPGVTNLLARYVSERAPGAPVRIGVLLGSGEKHGAAAVGWTVDGLGQESGSWTAEFPVPYGRRRVHRFPFSDQHTLDIPEVRTGLALDSRASTVMLGTANRPGVAKLLKRPALRPVTEKVFGGLHLGTDGFAVIAEADGVRASFAGNRQSLATGRFAAQVIRELPGMRPGVAHIEELVDPAEFLTTLAAEGFQLSLP
ncbi:MAG TPA: saccharopine dehydrogenase NADP-binding domain-containing protein [Actinoplanes sp.]|nr:saccharopine dehydrogenase NADP-binding domain-containing protein [Actinoplanes sp.]